MCVVRTYQSMLKYETTSKRAVVEICTRPVRSYMDVCDFPPSTYHLLHMRICLMFQYFTGIPV